MVPAEPVTDAHLHLWDLAESPYAWLAGAPAPLRRTVGIEDVRGALVELGVTRVVLVQADDTAEDTAHLQRTARTIEGEGGLGITRADVVGWLPLEDPDAVRAALEDPQRSDHLVGVRHLVHDDPDPGFLDRPEVAQSLDLLAEAGLSLDVPDAFERHMEQVARVARRHPGLTVVLDHLGKPPLGDREGMARWQAQLEAIAACPNVVAKVSGLATSGNGDFAVAADLALALFGPERLMIGSDWPIAPQHLDLASGFAPLLAHVRTWAPADVRAVTQGTAARVYRRLGEAPAR
ncbi:metal-dependent hydrolase [Brachybacterium avium]|uniref:Metal-dependent hydrolase n=1 Tax=Brachybacterium avium TaxID=2017485 RepID=A0A220UDS5_9MICO|nr:amidohydrolase family protein [Brachybacterium avium]ASK65873.1 metal-dependent hydrolase [Brachybacterium avium]